MKTLAKTAETKTGAGRSLNMSPDTFLQTLEALMSRHPFTPITIELHGGKRFEIDHPRATVWREGQGKAIFLSPGGVPIYFDNESVSQIIDAPAHVAP
jgi:hypothetical protein